MEEKEVNDDGRGRVVRGTKAPVIIFQSSRQLISILATEIQYFSTIPVFPAPQRKPSAHDSVLNNDSLLCVFICFSFSRYTYLNERSCQKSDFIHPSSTIFAGSLSQPLWARLHPGQVTSVSPGNTERQTHSHLGPIIPQMHVQFPEEPGQNPHERGENVHTRTRVLLALLRRCEDSPLKEPNHIFQPAKCSLFDQPWR